MEDYLISPSLGWVTRFKGVVHLLSVLPLRTVGLEWRIEARYH